MIMVVGKKETKMKWKPLTLRDILVPINSHSKMKTRKNNKKNLKVSD